jgi:hypothetical protein
MSESYTRLKGFYEIGESTLCDQLKANLISFFNWGLLGIGGFSNVTRSSGAAYDDAASPAQLRLVDDPNYELGQIWEAGRQDWVWESGVDYSYQPIQISGVYVDGAFHSSSSSGTYEHKIDYVRGRVIFTSGIPSGSVVEVNHSERYATFYSSDEPWFKEIAFNTYRVDDAQYGQLSSGVWTVLGQNRIQLPAIVVQTVPRRQFIPKQLGGGQYVRTDVIFHILAENTWDRDKLFDIISFQKEKTILSYDKNAMAEANRFPLDYDGALASGAMIYPDLVKSSGDGGFYWKKIYFKDMQAQDSKDFPPLFRATIRGTFEVDYIDI